MIAVLLGGMVSLARHVKSRGAEELTRQRIEVLRQRAELLWDDPESDFVERPMPKALNEPDLLAWATAGSAQLLAKLSKYDESVRPDVFYDAWGTPIAVAPRDGRQLGMSPNGHPFLVSAGPDRLFLSQADNLYSYDLIVPEVTTSSATGD